MLQWDNLIFFISGTWGHQLPVWTGLAVPLNCFVKPWPEEPGKRRLLGFFLLASSPPTVHCVLILELDFGSTWAPTTKFSMSLVVNDPY